jgi:hypothetical protein
MTAGIRYVAKVSSRGTGPMSKNKILLLSAVACVFATFVGLVYAACNSEEGNDYILEASLSVSAGLVPVGIPNPTNIVLVGVATPSVSVNYTNDYIFSLDGVEVARGSTNYSASVTLTNALPTSVIGTHTYHLLVKDFTHTNEDCWGKPAIMLSLWR